MPPLSQDWDLGRLKLCLGTLPFLIRTENNIHQAEIHGSRDSQEHPYLSTDLTSRTRLLTLRSLRELTTPLPNLLLLRGLAESFQ